MCMMLKFLREISIRGFLKLYYKSLQKLVGYFWPEAVCFHSDKIYRWFWCGYAYVAYWAGVKCFPVYDYRSKIKIFEIWWNWDCRLWGTDYAACKWTVGVGAYRCERCYLHSLNGRIYYCAARRIVVCGGTYGGRYDKPVTAKTFYKSVIYFNVQPYGFADRWFDYKFIGGFFLYYFFIRINFRFYRNYLLYWKIFQPIIFNKFFELWGQYILKKT